MRAAALLLTVVTGFTGLVYEVAWQKILAVLLGSHTEATAAVLGFFLGGLALGYAVFGAVTRRVVARAESAGRPARLLRLYAAVEAAIGGHALIFPWLFEVAQRGSLWLPAAGEELAFARDAALAAMLVVPPALLMGATVPMLTQALSRRAEEATRVHAAVYGLNAAGACIGALAASFWLLPALGLVGGLRAMGIVNLASGAAYALLDRGARSAMPAAAPAAAPGPGNRLGTLFSVALLVGFALMTQQSVLIRVGGLAAGASQFVFAMVVSVFVLAIAVGSLLVSLWGRPPRLALVADCWALLLLWTLVGELLDRLPYWAHVARSLFRDSSAGFAPYQGLLFLGLAALVGPPALAGGAALPLLFHAARAELRGLGAAAGRLYAWNTLGSLLGALLGGHVLLSVLDLHDVYRLALAALALAAVLVSVRVGGVPRLAGAGVLAAALGALALLPAWRPERLSSGLFRIRQESPATRLGADAFFASYDSDRIVFYDDDPVSSVAVKQRRLPDGRLDTSLVTNGKGDGSLLHDYATMSLAALIPALLAERAERAFVIGWGTGVTAGELAALQSMREVVVAEISPAVLRAAPLFDHGNLGASRHPRIHALRSDAYRALLRSEGRFDLIVSEPSNPWVQGVEMLYSRELLEVARAKLAPGGVHAQWFHLYETDDETLALVLRTYVAVFESVAVWYGLGVDLLVLGFADAETEVNLARLAARAAQPDFAAGLRRVGITSLPALLAHELLPPGVLNTLPQTGPLHTLLHPRLSQRAALAFFAGEGAEIPAAATPEAAALGARRSLVQRYAAARGAAALDAEDLASLVRELCLHRPRECVAALAWWTQLAPESPVRARLLHRLERQWPVAGRPQIERVPALTRLYAAPVQPKADVADQDGVVAPLLDAMQLSELYHAHYYHGAPFRREVLSAAWQRCEANAGWSGACRKARTQAEQVLGSFGR